MLSSKFPAKHIKAGQPTDFERAYYAAQGYKFSCVFQKVHTIRANYEFWSKRFKDIEAGKAFLSVRQWEGKPYRSMQREIDVLSNLNGIGLQKLEINFDSYGQRIAVIDGITLPSLRVLANNDGLSLLDWNCWFSEYDITKPLAIIHFTKFRY